MTNVYNFNPGPSPIPVEVLTKAKANMFNYEQSGMAVMEMSHRSPLYEGIHFRAMDQLRDILQIPETFDILFLQGGASLQFAMVALNFLPAEKKAGYVLTGSWSEKALKEASAIGETTIIASSKEDHYQHVPHTDLSKLSNDTAYVHLTSNNTIYGTQWSKLPERGDVPVIIDMSSDILSRTIPWENVDMVYAGAQKNAGMSGVTLVIMRKTLLESANNTLPPSLSYKQHADKQSLYNTPPTGAIYITGLVTEWIKQQGGVEEMARKAEKKAQMIYDVIDNSNRFYTGHAEPASRSLMNITFRLPSEGLEKKFLTEAKEKGFIGLNGHRSVGGCRVSNYNAVPVEHVIVLKEFMEQFMEQNG
ncbi:3-phosphoserine/phosphohydroxythreonine transaminase [Salipaludibacillus sp. LMS25]|jgi:phosphoserine aminotransferase|uniref:3-phosphoserine/phosphohydroxythreonine transaminase n=1 Tax=Salipaludibacillus sp. LMS25 TaxID=2924031 RepID=UPI0020D0B169|nr:3-phosphoserine/phosphohydroxythreonine transaminase [Salipaludibacillus sp. LMS25]UTR14221.1 3-phosphoserine/phosphohydroxythreonine transaminase [Salipaludibacillus sp. LMS25]